MKRSQRQRGGMDTLVVTLLVLPLLFFMLFLSVPFFVTVSRSQNLHHVAHHALKEAETTGYVSPAIMQRMRERMTALGYPSVSWNGTTYPSFAGSTMTRVLRTDPISDVRLVLMYPSPSLLRLGQLLGSSRSEQSGFYRIVVHGKSEAYAF